MVAVSEGGGKAVSPLKALVEPTSGGIVIGSSQCKSSKWVVSGSRRGVSWAGQGSAGT